jgi:transmembrane sensor
MTEELMDLYHKCMQGTASEAELARFQDLLLLPENEALSRQLLQDAFSSDKEAPLSLTPERSAIIQENIFRIGSMHQPSSRKRVVPFFPLKKRNVLWLSAAASVLVLISSVLFFNRPSQPEVLVEQRNTLPAQVISPGKDGAILTLANGEKIVLDSLNNGLVAMQSGAKVELENGQLLYKKDAAGDEVIAYNTISTPRGRQFQILLPDGSRVWMNAASTLRFPTTFTKKERRVELTGEAYFEIAKASQQNGFAPFIATVNDMEVKVLGTHFNIKAYGDEKQVKTTLLEGAVSISKTGTQPVRLSPGQQAVVAANQDIDVHETDTEEQVAWISNIFHFNNEEITSVMKQVERWYDVEVVYQSVPTKHFTGMISRKSDVESLLKKLETTGGMHFRMEGRKIIVFH